MRPRRSSLSLILVACLLESGCSRGEPTYVVRGTVTFDGKPVTGGVINFFPPQGKPLGGAIREDGTYRFELPAGDYRVAINTPPSIPAGWQEGDPVPHTEPQVPPHFARPDSSGLTLTVTEDEPRQAHDFELP